MNMKKLGNNFISGPIWCDWLAKASKVGVSPGLVGYALWFYVGVTKTKKFKIDSMVKNITNLSRQTISTSLKRLEKAGLISIYPMRGAYPTIHLHRETPSKDSNNDSIKSN